MGEPQTILSRLKQVGFIVTVILVVLQLASMCWGCVYSQRKGQGALWLAISGGCVRILATDIHIGSVGIHFHQVRDATWWVNIRPNKGGWSAVIVPLWMPIALFGVPLAASWWIDRRRRIPTGHCQSCGYNLRGNLSGICPECGKRDINGGSKRGRTGSVENPQP